MSPFLKLHYNRFIYPVMHLEIQYDQILDIFVNVSARFITLLCILLQKLSCHVVFTRSWIFNIVGYILFYQYFILDTAEIGDFTRCTGNEYVKPSRNMLFKFLMRLRKYIFHNFTNGTFNSGEGKLWLI